MNRAFICDFINRQRYGVVSSIGEGGTPQSALVGIVSTSDLDIVFDTLNNARKYRNLVKRPRCSMVVGCSGEQTLQLEGFVETPQGEDLRRFQNAYFARWPDGRERATWPGIAYFVVHLSWLRYSDFDQSPPFIQEASQEMILRGF